MWRISPMARKLATLATTATDGTVATVTSVPRRPRTGPHATRCRVAPSSGSAGVASRRCLWPTPVKCSQRLATTGYKRLQRLRGREIVSANAGARHGDRGGDPGRRGETDRQGVGRQKAGRGKRTRDGQRMRPVGEKRPVVRARGGATAGTSPQSAGALHRVLGLGIGRRAFSVPDGRSSPSQCCNARSGGSSSERAKALSGSGSGVGGASL